MDAHVISLANQKGGTAKTTTCANLGIGLAQAGRKVLLVDADAQGSLTLSLGWEPDELPITLYDLMIKAIQDRPVTHGEGMLHHEEGVDLLPANIDQHLWNRDSALCAGCGNQRRRKEHFCLCAQKQGGGSVSAVDEGGAGT